MNVNAHPPRFYEAYPEVTWDIAEDRWRGTRNRSDILFASCRSCGWHKLCDDEPPVLAKPERMRIAEFIAGSQHWYQCPGEPQIVFLWIISADGRGNATHTKMWRP